ncbi:uncharacterized protein A4U43_C04F14210 [Asparagus officinalis]|uniref:Uncharacterized protein n=1 Tax=Asparagus officinalis TaxID=4686 RepID=A0A5P1F646_ASPOF|nr:uncharacterized protein A4U43_C04F14210 [Asparagus officinalis]
METVADFVADKMNRGWVALEKAPQGSIKSKIHRLDSGGGVFSGGRGWLGGSANGNVGDDRALSGLLGGSRAEIGDVAELGGGGGAAGNVRLQNIMRVS